MQHRTKGIVLHQIKYSESSVILHCYTEQFGRRAYLVRGAKKRRGRHQGNLLQPLFLLDMQVVENPKRDLQHIREFRNVPAFHHIPFQVEKSSIALFLAEVLYRSLREEEQNQPLFDFLYHAIQFLDVCQAGVADFHLLFLLNLSKHLGFFPANNYSAGRPYFDLQTGEFVGSLPLHPHFMPADLSSSFSNLIGRSFQDFHEFSLSNKLRINLLTCLLDYYYLHLEGVKKINALEVLHQVFKD